MQHCCFSANKTDRYVLLFVFISVFKSLEVNAAILLCSLTILMRNDIDNLQTKEDLTYNHVYHKLLDLKNLAAEVDNKVYKSTKFKGEGRKQ
ncbi:hypothetical protein L873DRAFT_1816177 [Choiromyces venosus 120613-1]|uniref:Uncharacterized protein n=1 Tax=Choiromyces venosus 120613-1 TaxID=1336337 RepID=A0A3N4J7I3_9PEZI|nr:hypothetical protein L873DRAFT_1816177 [Choiromyces venosus 120613-1]